MVPRPKVEATDQENQGGSVLYFAYTARIAPGTMAEVAPDANFVFIAHLTGWGIHFPISGNGWDGALPTAVPAAGSTVWGAVYEVSEKGLSGIDIAETNEGRTATTVEAIDRSGKRYHVRTHLGPEDHPDDLEPSAEYLSVMVNGSRHWGLPAGWVIGLEDHLGQGL